MTDESPPDVGTVLDGPVEEVAIDDVEQHPRNAREGDIGAIVESIKANGVYRPLIVQRTTGHVLAGNHTLAALRALNASTVPVQYVDVDDDAALRILLVDNRTTDLARYDDRALADLLANLATGSKRGLAGTGFDGDFLDELISDLDLAMSPLAERASEDDHRVPQEPGQGDEFYTPAWVFQCLALQFDLDVCAPSGGCEWIPAARFYTKADDGLTAPWAGRVWCNPPYSKPGPWVARWLEHANGVLLVPFSKSEWFTNLWESSAALCFAGKRGSDFVGGPIPWPTVFAALGAENVGALEALGGRVR